MTIATEPTTPRKRYTVTDSDGKFIGKAELRAVPVASIKIDHAYQRDTSSSWVEEHRPFDARQAGTIVLSGRAGGPFCIDGGHRLAIAKADGVPLINAFVIDNLTQGDEARLFTRYQRERRNLTSFALFRADLVSRDPDTMAMDRVVRANGFMLAKTASDPRNITAIDSIRYIQRVGGEDLLHRTLRLVGQFWIGEEKALSGQVLKGMGLFLQSAGEQSSFRQGTLDKLMDRMAPVKLLRLSLSVSHKRGAAPAATPANVAEAIHEEYNKLVRDEAEKLRPLTIGNRARPNRVWSQSEKGKA